MKVLIVKRDKLGDMLLTTPLIAYLKSALPQAQIHVLASQYNAWVIENHPAVTRVWAYPRVRTGKRIRLSAAWAWWRMRSALRAEKFDVAIAANGDDSPRAIARALTIKARQTVFYSAAPARWRSTPGAVCLPVPTHGHELERLLGLSAGVADMVAESALPNRFPDFTPSPAMRDEAQAWLAQQQLRAGQFVVLGLGARRAKKQPSCEQILGLASALYSRYQLRTVFMWTPGAADNPLYPGDDATAEPVLAAEHPHIVPFRGPLGPALGLIWQAATSVFPDSGLMHFAAASPGGVLGLFAETEVSPHPDQWGPRGTNVGVLEAKNQIEDLSLEVLFDAVQERLLATVQ